MENSLKSVEKGLKSMENTLAVKILKGSFFLVLALIASYVPRLLGLPGAQTTADIANTLALFMKGVIWGNIIIGYYIQRYVNAHAAHGGISTAVKAIGGVARLL